MLVQGSQIDEQSSNCPMVSISHNIHIGMCVGYCSVTLLLLSESKSSRWMGLLGEREGAFKDFVPLAKRRHERIQGGLCLLRD